LARHFKPRALQADEEDGLMHLLSDVLSDRARIQARYENILGNEYSFFEQVTEYCQIDVSRERLQDTVRYNYSKLPLGENAATRM
jgi:hypothetical protein